MYQSLLQTWRRMRSRRPGADPTDRPLLDAARVSELARRAEALPHSLIGFERPASHPLIGEVPAAARGRGFEFVENRAYQPGDEPRLLNWRAYARSGELYTRVFSEERRPQVFLVVDRRAAMRFGTRRRLKAALAAEIALCHAFQARCQGLPVGGLILDRAPEWLTPGQGEAALEALVHALGAPCPPLDFRAPQPALETGLRGLLHRLPAGAFLLLVSDFADLDADAARPLLQALSALHTVHAVQVLDPVEQALPTGGELLIADGAAQPLRIGADDTRQRVAYAEAIRDRQAQLAAAFAASLIPLRTCTTPDPLDACLDPFHAAAH